MLKKIPSWVDLTAERAKVLTTPFVKSWAGQMFLSIVLIGPLTFLPTVWAAWTEPNIDALRTYTWPLLVVVNLSTLLSLVHKGDWRMRLILVVWTLEMASVWLATLVR